MKILFSGLLCCLLSSLTLSCRQTEEPVPCVNGSARMTEAPEQFNISIRVRDGSDSSCVRGVLIEVNGAEASLGPYDSTACRYGFEAWEGVKNIVLSKSGYDTLKLPPVTVTAIRTYCRPYGDTHDIEVAWYKTGISDSNRVTVK